jgi:hypothetical protein
MAGFSKLHSSIATSSLMALPVATRWLWTFLLSQANAQGIVEGSVSGLAVAAHISLEECEAGIAAFLAPDKYSRTKDREGRRLVALDDGWQIVSYQKWRDKLSADERREYKRLHEQTRRDRQHAKGTTAADQAPEPPPAKSDRTITEKQQRRIFEVTKVYDLTTAQIKAYLATKGIKSTKAIKVSQYDQIMEELLQLAFAPAAGQ